MKLNEFPEYKLVIEVYGTKRNWFIKRWAEAGKEEYPIEDITKEVNVCAARINSDDELTDEEFWQLFMYFEGWRPYEDAKY
jgi:hypothetical protein